jgi:stalled ribosome rescue protein Dom34
MSRHTVVWLDQHEAIVLELQPDDFEASIVKAPASHIHRHAKGATEAKSHPEDLKHFFHDLVHALSSAQEILVVGPGVAKLHFIKYVHKNAHDLEPKIIGVETVDHPTDAQLVAHARSYFLAADRMR